MQQRLPACRGRQPGPARRAERLLARVAALDDAPVWTLDQVGGLGSGEIQGRRAPECSWKPLRPARSRCWYAARTSRSLTPLFSPLHPSYPPQSVGLVFAFLLLGLYLSSSQLDKWVARRQRRQLGLCEECGGLYDPETCTQKACPSKGKPKA